MIMFVSLCVCVWESVTHTHCWHCISSSTIIVISLTKSFPINLSSHGAVLSLCDSPLTRLLSKYWKSHYNGQDAIQRDSTLLLILGRYGKVGNNRWCSVVTCLFNCAERSSAKTFPLQRDSSANIELSRPLDHSASLAGRVSRCMKSQWVNTSFIGKHASTDHQVI